LARSFSAAIRVRIFDLLAGEIGMEEVEEQDGAGAALLELQLLLDASRDPLHVRDSSLRGAEAATGWGICLAA